MIPIDASSVVARFDPVEGSWLFGDGLCGPAGLARLDCGPGFTVLADCADPALLVEVAVFLNGTDSAASPEQVQAVAALLGDEAASLLVATTDTAGPLDTVVAVDPSTVDARQRLGRLALLLELRGGDGDGSDTGLWAAEAAYLAQACSIGLIQPIAQAEAAAGAQALLAVRPWRPSLAGHLASIAEVLAALVEDVDPSTARALRTRVGRDGGEGRRKNLELSDVEVDAVFAEMSVALHDLTLETIGVLEPSLVRSEAEVEGAMSATFTVDPAMAPPGVLDPSRRGRAIWDRRRGVVDVRVPCLPGGLDVPSRRLWALLWHPERDVTLAMSLLQPDVSGELDGVWRSASLRVSSNVALSDLAVSVTTDPLTRPPGGPRLRLQEAIGAGEAALRAERLGRWERAADDWWLCANRWSVLDDINREGLALERCAIAFERDGDADEAAVIRQRRGRLPMTWGRPLLGAAPAVVPFLAEVIKGFDLEL